MNQSNEHIKELIDRYLSNELQGAELAEFEARIKSDNVLKNEIEFQRTLLEGIKFARKKELKEFISASVIELESSARWNRTFLKIAAVLVLAIGTTMWFYFDPLNNDEKNLVIKDKSSGEKTSNAVEKPSSFTQSSENKTTLAESTIVAGLIEKSVQDKVIKSQLNELQKADNNKKTSSTVFSSGTDNLVSNDQSLSSNTILEDPSLVYIDDSIETRYLLAVNVTNSEYSDAPSINNFTQRGLSPNTKKSGAAENPTKPDIAKTSATTKNKNYTIEIWENPKKQLQYKFENDTIIKIFGVDNKQYMSILVLNQSTYLEYSNFFYLLEKSNQYKPLTPVTDPKIISILNK